MYKPTYLEISLTIDSIACASSSMSDRSALSSEKSVSVKYARGFCKAKLFTIFNQYSNDVVQKIDDEVWCKCVAL